MGKTSWNKAYKQANFKWTSAVFRKECISSIWNQTEKPYGQKKSLRIKHLHFADHPTPGPGRNDADQEPTRRRPSYIGRPGMPPSEDWAVLLASSMAFRFTSSRALLSVTTKVSSSCSLSDRSPDAI